MASLAVQQRQQQLALRAQMVRTLMAIWPALDPARLDATFPAWSAAVGQIIMSQRATSSSLAAEYLAASRRAARVSGPAVIVPADPVVLQRLDASLRVTSVIQVKRSMIAGRPIAQAMDAAFVSSTGAATNLALEGGRETLQQSIKADPKIVSWQRIGGGKSCDFCAMLIGRGAVYKEETVDFPAHDHCACMSQPLYR
jgi:hypothetical protein